MIPALCLSDLRLTAMLFALALLARPSLSDTPRQIAAACDEEIVTLHVVDCPLRDVLTGLAAAVKSPVRLEGDLSGRISADLRAVPLEAALKRILAGRSFALEWEHGTADAMAPVRLATVHVYAKADPTFLQADANPRPDVPPAGDGDSEAATVPPATLDEVVDSLSRVMSTGDDEAAEVLQKNMTPQALDLCVGAFELSSSDEAARQRIVHVLLRADSGRLDSAVTDQILARHPELSAALHRQLTSMLGDGWTGSDRPSADGPAMDLSDEGAEGASPEA